MGAVDAGVVCGPEGEAGGGCVLCFVNESGECGVAFALVCFAVDVLYDVLLVFVMFLVIVYPSNAEFDFSDRQIEILMIFAMRDGIFVKYYECGCV